MRKLRGAEVIPVSERLGEAPPTGTAAYPFRMMWFTPLIGGMMVLLVSVVAAEISVRPVLKLEPGVVFAGR